MIKISYRCSIGLISGDYSSDPLATVTCLFFPQELTAIKARVQELEMEEETERLKEEERCDAGDMQLLTSSPRPGETALRVLSALWFVVASHYCTAKC